MKCEYFGKCGSCTLYEMDYESQLSYKVNDIKKEFNLENLDIFSSPPSHFRYRSEFRIYHDYEKQKLSYAMHTLSHKGLVQIDNCSIISKAIEKKMQALLDEIKDHAILKERLFGVEFLSSTLNEVLITLIYHKKIDHQWEDEAKKLAQKLHVDLIGRSRGIKIIVTKEYIDESLTILDEKYFFRLYDTGFTQPNPKVNEKMIGWVKNNISKQADDLLELYCGHGNFTIPLSKSFRKVLATEVSKRSIKSALENCTLNNIQNIDFIRLSSEELTQALEKKRTFNRLKDVDLDDYNFSYIFVDPPRAGLDPKTLTFIQNYQNIIYISCNPITLKRDLEVLKNNFQVEKFAVFDQFAYTKHIECGVILKRI